MHISAYYNYNYFKLWIFIFDIQKYATIILMADDTTLFPTNLALLTHSINTFNKFEECSGIKLTEDRNDPNRQGS